MPVVDIAPEKIQGPWDEGWVLSRHSIRSIPVRQDSYGRTRFDTVRTPLGELVYQLKNRGGPPEDIVETALSFITARWRRHFDGIIPMPPSIRRVQQPGIVLASALAATLNTVVLNQVVEKPVAPLPLKNLERSSRAQTLARAIVAGPQRVDGLTILLVDDLWETGSTMRRVAEVVRAQGAKAVYAVAMTRTK